jgi:hypothetical protein
MPYEISNPIARFYLQGDADNNDNTEAIVDLFGENGEQVQVKFNRPGESGAIAEMLWECALDLAEAQTYGIMQVAERRGEYDESDLTVDQILSESDKDIKPVEDAERNKGIVYPWQDDYEAFDAQENDD